MMSTQDIWGLVFSYAYAFGLLVIVEFIGRRLKWPQFVTRKIIHIGAGMWTWAILLLFDHWYIGVIPFATFIVLNYLFYRFRFFSAMDSEKESPGTVYFAISITILFLLGWRNHALDYRFVILPAIMVMTWGDAMASLIGRFWGSHRYQIWGGHKSYEGSIVMLFTGFLAVLVSLLVLRNTGLSLPLSEWTINKMVLLSGATAIVTTLIEAVSPAGTDNLFVPLIAAAIMWLGA